MAADENGAAAMLIGDLAKGLSDPVTKTCPAVGPWNYWSKWIPLLEITQIIFCSDLFPSKAICFSQPEFLKIDVNVDVEV